MSRSGYSDDCEYLELYRASVHRALHGKRGKAFLREMAAVLDAMPVKRLSPDVLVGHDGAACAMGEVAKARGVDVSYVDETNPDAVAGVFGLARSMAAEIAYINDEEGPPNESPEARWLRVREWLSWSLGDTGKGER